MYLLHLSYALASISPTTGGWVILRLSQPSLAGAGAELGNTQQFFNLHFLCAIQSLGTCHVSANIFQSLTVFVLGERSLGAQGTYTTPTLVPVLRT